MDARLQTPDARAELARLRRRAYGPDADIAGDPDAVARLALLETSLKTETDAATDVPDESVDAADDSAGARQTRRPGPAHSGRSLLARVAVCVAIAAASAAVAVAATLATVAATVDRPDATLEPVAVDPVTDVGLDGQWLQSFRINRADLQGYEEYRGVRPWVGTAADGLLCLFVTSADRGLVAQSCTPPSIPPVADGVVGNGTVSLGGGPRGILRFQVHGDVLDVYDRMEPFGGASP